MTIDSVVQKTGMTLGLTILVAVATWVLTPDPGTGADAGSLYLLLMVGAFGGFALSMVNSFKRVDQPRPRAASTPPSRACSSAPSAR